MYILVPACILLFFVTFASSVDRPTASLPATSGGIVCAMSLCPSATLSKRDLTCPTQCENNCRIIDDQCCPGVQNAVCNDSNSRSSSAIESSTLATSSSAVATPSANSSSSSRSLNATSLTIPVTSSSLPTTQPSQSTANNTPSSAPSSIRIVWPSIVLIMAILTAITFY